MLQKLDLFYVTISYFCFSVNGLSCLVKVTLKQNHLTFNKTMFYANRYYHPMWFFHRLPRRTLHPIVPLLRNTHSPSSRDACVFKRYETRGEGSRRRKQREPLCPSSLSQLIFQVLSTFVAWCLDALSNADFPLQPLLS